MKFDVFGEVVVAAFAGRYVIADDVGFDYDVLSDFEVVHAFADGINHAGEFVSHRYGRGLAGNQVRMAAGRDENRTFHKFVQVGTADAAPGDVDADGAGGDGRFRGCLRCGCRLYRKKRAAFIVTLLVLRLERKVV